MAKPPMRPGVIARLATNFWDSIFKGRQIDSKSKVVGNIILVRPGVMERLATNFLNSIVKGRQIDSASKVVGDDILGNRYHEIPADPSRGRRRGRRWFTNEVSKHHDPRGHETVDGFDAQIPSEWESWLRFRRDEPPTAQQVLQSFALADLKKVIYQLTVG